MKATQNILRILPVGLAFVSVVGFLGASPVWGYPQIHVDWGPTPGPILDSDYKVHTQNQEDPPVDCSDAWPCVELITASDSWYVWSTEGLNPGDIGVIYCPYEASFEVMIAPKGKRTTAGARDVKKIHLVPTEDEYYSSLLAGSHISGDLKEELRLEATPGGAEGILNLTIGGNVEERATITVREVGSLHVGGDLAGELSVAGDAVGDIELYDLSGTVDIEGSLLNDLDVSNEMAGGFIYVKGEVGFSADIAIENMVTGVGASHAHFNEDGSSKFIGKLFLTNGVPASQWVRIDGKLDGIKGTIDLNEAGVGVDGSLYVYGGGARPIGAVGQSQHGGTVSGTVVLGRYTKVYSGTATFSSVSSGGKIKTFVDEVPPYDGTDFPGTVDIIGAVAGTIEINGNLGGDISVGTNVTGDGEIHVAGDIEPGASITLTSGVSGNVEGLIDVDQDVGGTITVGKDVTGTGSIVTRDVKSNGKIYVTGDVNGEVKVERNLLAGGEIKVRDVGTGKKIWIVGDIASGTPDGLIDVTRDVLGTVYVEGSMNGDINIGYDLDGTIDIDGSMNGDIDIGDDLDGNIEIDLNMDGDIVVGNSVSTGKKIWVKQNVQSNGSITLTTGALQGTIEVDQDMDGTITLSNVETGDVVGTIDIAGSMNGLIDVNGTVSGDIDLDGNVGGDVLIATLEGQVDIHENGDLSGKIDIETKMQGGIIEVHGKVTEFGEVDINNMETGSRDSRVSFRTLDRRDVKTFDGKLYLRGGLPAAQKVEFYVPLLGNALVDFSDGQEPENYQDLAGIFELNNGCVSGAQITGVDEVTASSVVLGDAGYDFACEATFASVGSTSTITTADGDLDGTLTIGTMAGTLTTENGYLGGTVSITGDLSGTINIGRDNVEADIEAPGEITIGGDLTSDGWIHVYRDMLGEINVAGDMEGLIEIDQHLNGLIYVAGYVTTVAVIDVDGSMHNSVDPAPETTVRIEVGQDLNGDILVDGDIGGGTSCQDPAIYVAGDVCGIIHADYDDNDDGDINGYVTVDGEFNGDICGENLDPADTLPANICIEFGLAGTICGQIPGTGEACPPSCNDLEYCTDDTCVEVESEVWECQYECDPWPYADVYPVFDGDGAVEGSDITCVLDAANNLGDCLAEIPEGYPRPAGYAAGDIYPCDPPDGAVEGNDILAVLDAANDIFWCDFWCDCDPCSDARGGGGREGGGVGEARWAFVTFLTMRTPNDEANYRGLVMLVAEWLIEHMTCEERAVLAEELQDPGLKFNSLYSRRLVPSIVDILVCE